jgi:hypothetical protein
MFQFPKTATTIKGKAPDAYLYEPEKKDKKVSDKDLFVMNKREIKK